MKTRETTPGKTYSVHTSSGCTVSDKNGWSKTIDAPDGYFTAHAGEVTIDGDDAADVREVFKLAPQQRLTLLGVLGGNAGGLPAGYKLVEWLESTGTQVIDTDIYPGDKDDGFDIKFVSLEPEIAYNPLLSFACSATNITERRNFGFESVTSNFILVSQTWTAFNKKKVVGETYIASGSRQYIKNIITLIVNDEPLTPMYDYVVTYHYANCGVTYALFGQKTLYDYGTRFTSFGKWRVFYCKMYLESQLVRDFIPCIDPTGAPCMFDMVTKKPFYNQGTGDFIYPTETATYSLRRVLPDWGKLTEAGLRRLYHAPASYKGELYDYALENGYKPIVEPEKPETGYWSPRWTETEDEIVLEWVETEPPMEDLTNN